MAQDYKLLSFEKSDFQDNNGNYWCTAVFDGGEGPVKWVMQAKTVPTVAVGESYYGEIRSWTSAKGQVFPRFYREKKEAPQQSAPITLDAVKKTWEPRDDSHIKAQWAIGQAVQVFIAAASQGHTLPQDYIETKAVQFYSMVERVRVQPDAAEPLPTPPTDKVYDVPDDEPIDPNDIPF